jgi:hypothetical protein
VPDPSIGKSVPDSPPRISEHGARVAAGRIGCAVVEYRERAANGEAWCGGHRGWHPQTAFSRQANRPNGLQAYCDEVRKDMLARRRYSLLTPEGAMTVSRADSAWSEPAASCAQPVAVPSGHIYRAVDIPRPMQLARLERMQEILGVPVSGVERVEVAAS